ncbi:hypothetical protein WDR88_001827 [Enterobacter cloacae]|nr:hypothetical protein [Enterobacter cloacae]
MLMNVRVLLISMLISLPVFFTALFLAHKINQPNAIACSGLVNIEIKNNTDNLYGSVFISAHIIPKKGKRSYVSEKGYLFHGSHKFIVNRHVRLLFNEINDNGFSEVSVEGIDKAPDDTMPDSLRNKLYASQKIFYYKFEKIQNNLWRWRDLQRTVFMCKVIV